MSDLRNATPKNLGVLERYLAIFWAEILCNLWILFTGHWDCRATNRLRFYETKFSFESMIVGVEARRGKNEIVKVFYEDTRFDEDDN